MQYYGRKISEELMVKVSIILLLSLFLLTSCSKDDDVFKIKTIKEGHKAVLSAPHTLDRKDVYSSLYVVTEDIFKVNTASGWAKLWGVSFVHPHCNSFRFVFKVKGDSLELGYYSYINKVSPQDNTGFKGYFGASVVLYDRVEMEIEFEDETIYRLRVNDTLVLTQRQPLPKGWDYPIIENNPNINVPAAEDLSFYFLY